MKYKDTCNRRINWNVYERKSGNLVGAVGVNSAILCLSCRDKWIGWTQAQRKARLNNIANNYRFALISKNATLSSLGSQLLKSLRYAAPPAWQQRYDNELVLLETLVKPPWTGTVYKADNWISVGMTKGVSFSKAPVLLWQKEKSARGDLARANPKEAIARYAVGRTHYAVSKSEPKLVFIRPLRPDWRARLCT